MTESKENSSKWGNYGEQYQQLMMKIPFVFSVKAASLLFPSLLSRTIEHERIYLVDIAAGPGVFESALFDSMHRCSLRFAPDSAIVVTDFAPGMIEAAKKALHANDLHSIGMDNVKFDVVDACDPHSVENHSFTHIACMFGIMFFPKRAQALQRLREKLIPGVGRALFGSWNYANPVQLCHKFGLFLDPNAEIHRPSQESSPLNVCKDPDVFKEELVVAGFHDIEIVQEEHTFDLENDDLLFNAFICNPALTSMYPELSLDKNPLDVLRHRWQEFLHSEEGRRNWLTIHPDGKETVKVRYIANLAIALA